MAFPSPRLVRSSSSKSLRMSLTSFPRPFCSFHVFSGCAFPLFFPLSPPSPPPLPLSLLLFLCLHLWSSSPFPNVRRSTPEVAPLLDRFVQIQSRVQWILSSSSSCPGKKRKRTLDSLDFEHGDHNVECLVRISPRIFCDRAGNRAINSQDNLQ